MEDQKGLIKGGKGGPSGPVGRHGGLPDKDPDNAHQGEKKRGNDKFQRFGNIDKEMDSNHDDSREDCLGMELVSNIEKNRQRNFGLSYCCISP